MQKLIKIGFNLSYIVSLSALVFLGSLINGVAEKKSNNDADSRTIPGSNLSLNHASADVPSSGGDGYSGDGGGGGGSDGCDGGGGGCN